MFQTPFYDPKKTYEENFEKGPFGAFANDLPAQAGEIIENKYGGNASVEPEFNFLGFKVNSPFGIGAGPLINGKFVQAALDKGFDIVTYKTVRSGKYPCHPWPNVLSVKIDGDLTLKKAEGKLLADKNYREPLSITNSFGVPSFDPEFWQKDLSNAVKYAKEGQIVIGSFQGTKKEAQNIEEYINDFAVCAKFMKETGVKVFEVNLSCPNEGTNNLLCFDVERSVKVVKAIKKEIGNIPLIIKISYFKDAEVLKNLVKEIGQIVEGISAINTISAEIVDEKGEQALPGEGRLRSGVCGYAIKWAGLETVKRLKNLRKEFEYNFQIIGVGGVMNADDFFEYQNAGADVVMSVTGAMWNPYLGNEIKSRLY